MDRQPRITDLRNNKGTKEKDKYETELIQKKETVIHEAERMGGRGCLSIVKDIRKHTIHTSNAL